MSEDKKSGGDDINFSLNNQGKINQAAGKIENNDNAHVGDINHYGDKPLTVDDIFDNIEKTLQSTDEITEADKQEIRKEVLEPLKEMAKTDPEEAKKKPGFMEKAQGFFKRLAPHASTIGAGLLEFGEGALAPVAATHPILGGLFAATKVIKSLTAEKEDDEDDEEKPESSSAAMPSEDLPPPPPPAYRPKY